MSKCFVLMMLLVSFIPSASFAEIGNLKFKKLLKEAGVLRGPSADFCGAIAEDFNTLKSLRPGTFFFRELPDGDLIINFLNREGNFRVATVPWDLDFPYEGSNAKWLPLISEFRSWKGRTSSLPWSRLSGLSEKNLLSPLVLPETSVGTSIKLISDLLQNNWKPSDRSESSSCHVGGSAQSVTPTLEDVRPLYCNGDSVLDGTHSIPAFGSTVTLAMAEESVQNVLDQKPHLTRRQLHGSQLFHGSASSSLLAFTEYGKSQGHLTPLGQLEKEGRVPFSGEIVFGRDGVSSTGLSTTWAGTLNLALKYASPSAWSPDKAAGVLKQLNQSLAEGPNLFDRNLKEITEKRLKEWPKLTDSEKALVSDSFPVLYGIKPVRAGVAGGAHSDIDGEVVLKDGAFANEIQALFVPTNQIKRVRDLLALSGHSSIAVEPIEVLGLPAHLEEGH